jgi:predicted O-methyltransferase YrrM
MPLLKSRPVRRALKPVITAVDRRIKRLVGAGITDVRAELGAEIAGVRAELKETRQQLEDLRADNYPLELLLGGTGRGNSNHRKPTKAQIMKLADEVREVTGAATAELQIHLAYRTLVVLEALGAGRVAGRTMNVIGKLSTIPLLKPPNDDVLEIGTLHGLFAAGLARQLIRDGRTPSLTIVDPLAEIQLQSGRVLQADPSGTPIAENVVRTNLTLSGLPQERMRLQCGFSSAPEVRAAVSDREYGVIIIDGDHSEEGVRADLEWSETIVASGGIVVVDDYTDRDWPGVEAAVRKHLAGHTRLTLIGRTATSGFLRAL